LNLNYIKLQNGPIVPTTLNCGAIYLLSRVRDKQANYKFAVCWD